MRSGGNSGLPSTSSNENFSSFYNASMQISGRRSGFGQERSEGGGHCTIIKG